MWSNLFLRVKVTVLSQPNQKATEKHDTRATQYPRGCNSLLTHEACDVFTLQLSSRICASFSDRFVSGAVVRDCHEMLTVSQQGVCG